MKGGRGVERHETCSRGHGVMAVEQFEIQVSRGGRWQIEGVDGNEKEAIAIAKKKLGQPGIEGVRVIKEATRRFGQPETVFEQQGRQGDGELITLAQIDDAPAKCQK